MDAFTENWNESQFWYSQETASILANQLLRNCTNETTIAVVSAPSVFVQLKNILAARGIPEHEAPVIFLLEFDERFSVFPEFIFYDFHNPLKLPCKTVPAAIISSYSCKAAKLKASIDHIICDPPFLSEDCQTKGVC